MSVSQELITLSDTAELLSLSLSTVKRLIGKGALTSICIGRSRRVYRSSIDALLAGGGQV